MADLKRHGHAMRHGGWTRSGVAWVTAAFLLLWATGVVLYAWPADSTFDLAPWQAIVRRAALIAHGFCVWLLCVLGGHWLWTHMAMVWRRRRDSTWLLGLFAAVVLGTVAVTGFLLLYGSEALRTPASAIHWWVAVGLPLLLLIHGRAWWRRRR